MTYLKLSSRLPVKVNKGLKAATGQDLGNKAKKAKVLIDMFQNEVFYKSNIYKQTLISSSINKSSGVGRLPRVDE